MVGQSDIYTSQITSFILNFDMMAVPLVSMHTSVQAYHALTNPTFTFPMNTDTVAVYIITYIYIHNHKRYDSTLYIGIAIIILWVFVFSPYIRFLLSFSGQFKILKH